LRALSGGDLFMSRSFLVLVVAVLALVTGCQPSRSPQLFIDSDFSPEEVEALIAGSEEWSSHPELHLDFHVFLGSHDDVSKDPFWRADSIQVVRMRGLDCPFGTPPQGWSTTGHWAAAVGLTLNNPVSTSRGVCLDMDGMTHTKTPLANAFAHELGHVYGLQGSGARGA
jgi:hypothetical protein